MELKRIPTRDIKALFHGPSVRGGRGGERHALPNAPACSMTMLAPGDTAPGNQVPASVFPPGTYLWQIDDRGNLVIYAAVPPGNGDPAAVIAARDGAPRPMTSVADIEAINRKFYGIR